jgi:aerobic carbon-monoxide dehydrogenase large subunit
MDDNSVFGKPIKRNEDPLLLKGQALFVDDIHLPGMAHIAFMRSPHAHARILSIDTSAAQAYTGVIAVYTAKDLADYMQPAPLIVPPPPVKDLIFHERTHYPMAYEKVRYAGEIVAMVVAESRYLAEDALELIEVEYESLGVVVDVESSLQPGAPLIHEDLSSNLAAHVVQEKGDYAAASAKAYRMIRRRFEYDRGTASAIENRGIVASWDRINRRLTMWDTTQAPIPIRNGLARYLKLSENQVHIIAPFIGGGFGAKVFTFYSEEMLVPWAAMQTNRPLKWIEDRLENYSATVHERSQVHEAEIALDEDGRILGVKDIFIHDSGAYDNYGLTVPINSQCTLLGTYDIPNYYSEFKVAFTNKPLVSPYRGAGRQHGIFVIERLIDLAAREMNMDAVKMRQINLLRGPFPHDNQIIYQDFAPLVYDSGNYAPILEKALEMIGYEQFIQQEQPELRKAGRKVGIGVTMYVEGTGIGPYEGARVQVLCNGKVLVVTGVGTQGQGHYTSFAQIAAEQLGVKVEQVEVVTGDTAQFHWGTGTFASRGAVVAGNAVHAAACKVRSKIFDLAARILSVKSEDLELSDGAVFVRYDKNQCVTLEKLAALSNPLRGAVTPGSEPGLESTQYFGPERGATAAGAHAIKVEIDPGTLQVKILQYVVVHDCGKMINPLIVEGQVHGGVAQGIGNAFFEELVYDELGRLRNANMRDYLLPTAQDIPHIETGHLETISPLNPLGVKGAGEAGAIPTGAVFAQAVENAFDDPGIEILNIPLSASKLYEIVMLQNSPD